MFKCVTKKVLFVRCMALIVSLHVSGSSRVKRGFCSTRNLDIENGSYRLRSGNSVAEFTCNEGFILFGVERIVCFTSRWSNDPPVCISNTCKKISPTSTLKIEEEFEGSLLKFSCAVLFRLDGSEQLICDGTNWNAPVPTCKPWTPPLSCDFEDSELCGWSHHDKDDQDWRWNTGKTSTSRTGPTHDHTLGDVGNGHYMYFETSSPTRTNHKAVLKSPLYPTEFSQQKCFIFWYHILGEGDISDLEVFVKPESVDDLTDSSKLQRIFHINQNGGDEWYQESSQVPPQTEPFQVLFTATRGTNYRSDIAIDDVAIGECLGTLPPVITTTTQNATPSTESSFKSTKKTTTQKTTVATRPKTTPEPVTTTRRTTTKATTKEPKTTQDYTHPVTTRKTTLTTKKATVTTQISTVTTKAKVSATQAKTSLRQTNATGTPANTNKPTLTPKINPNLIPQKKHVPGESRDGPSVVWIVLGVALVLVIAIAVLFGIYLYRRKKKHSRKLDTLSSSNPLYTAVNGDEAAVHFAADDTDGLGDY